MSTSISTAFVKQYEGDVHAAYQRMSSKCRGSVPVSYTHLTLPTKRIV